MKRLILCSTLLLAVPMALLNPLGREAFLGYYAGILGVWLTIVCIGAWQQTNPEPAEPS